MKGGELRLEALKERDDCGEARKRKSWSRPINGDSRERRGGRDSRSYFEMKRKMKVLSGGAIHLRQKTKRLEYEACAFSRGEKKGAGFSFAMGKD